MLKGAYSTVTSKTKTVQLFKRTAQGRVKQFCNLQRRMNIVQVASYTSFESCTVTGNLGKNYVSHIRASVRYESPFFKNIY